jgi:PIN domain nuclease of toxin-antitoxin system
LTLCWRAAIRLLLDSQVLILAYLGALPARVQAVLAEPEAERLISAISIAEIAIKNSIGKLEMGEQEAARALEDLQVGVIPLESQYAAAMFSLPLHHRDPFDRMILATAVVEKLPIVTGDRIFRRYSGVKIIW